VLDLIKPLHLDPGDTIGVISPGSPVDKELLQRGMAFLEKKDFRTRIGKSVFEQKGYLAGTDYQRLEDLHSMFVNSEIKAIFYSRGGYGSIRLLEYIDNSLIRNSPKILVGYSDATAIQWALLQFTGLITFSGPMAAPDFGSKDVDNKTADHCLSMLRGDTDALNLTKCSTETLEVLNSGNAAGPVICGCLTLICNLVGTQYCPQLDGAILVIEDIGEEPYKIDRAITMLQHHGVFDRVSGLVVGKFVNCEAENQRDKHITVPDILYPVVKKYGIPALMNLSYGHIPDKLTIPIGAQGMINTKNREFIITESVVN